MVSLRLLILSTAVSDAIWCERTAPPGWPFLPLPLGGQELHALSTHSVDFSVRQGRHPEPKSTHPLDTSRSGASQANSSLQGDQKPLQGDRPALFEPVVSL